MADLTGKKIANTYKNLLQVDSPTDEGVESTPRRVQDGEGENTALEISTNSAKVYGNLGVTGNVSAVGITVTGFDATEINVTRLSATSITIGDENVATSSQVATVSATLESRIAGVSSTFAATSATLETRIQSVSANLVSTSATLESHINTVSATLSTTNVALQTSISNHLPLAGGTITGTVTFQDKVTASFGNSNDLDIYHQNDGVHGGYIVNNTGQLFIQAGDSFGYLRDSNNNSQLSWGTNGLVLYHDNFVVGGTSATGLHIKNTVSATQFVGPKVSVTNIYASGTVSAVDVYGTNIYVNGVTVADASAVASVNTIALAAASAATSANLETRIQAVSVLAATVTAGTSANLETRINAVSVLAETKASAATSVNLQTRITINTDAITSINNVVSAINSIVNDVNASAIAANAQAISLANTSIAANASTVAINLAAITSVNTIAVAAMPKAGGTFSGEVTFDDTVRMNGPVIQLGNSSNDTIQTTGRFSVDLLPFSNNFADLGSDSLRYSEIHGTTIFQAGVTVANTSVVADLSTTMATSVANAAAAAVAFAIALG